MIPGRPARRNDGRDRHQQVDRCRDGADVRPRIQGVGYDQGHHGRVDQCAGVPLPEHARQASSRHQADLGAHVLDGRHHRQHDQRRPERRETVLRTRLSIGPDPGWVVVRCSGDEARSEHLPDAFQRVSFGPQLGRLWVDRPPGVHLRLAGPGRSVPARYAVNPHARPAVAPATPPAGDTRPAPPAADPRPAQESPGTG